MGEMWYTNLGYDELKRFIKSNIQSMTREFVSVGYYLKYIRDNEMYLEDGYESIWEFAEDQYGIQRTTCSRWMAINDRFSVDGNSPTLAEEYREYSKSQLQEMLYLDDKQMEEVKPDMTVKDIRKIRTPDPVFEEVEEEIPGQMNVEDYPELLPEQKTTVELQKPTEEVYEYLNAFARKLIKLHRNWFLEDYQNRVMNVTTSPILIKQEFCEGRSRTHYFEIREESAFINLFDDYVQVFSVNCDYLGDYDWFYLAAAIQSMWNVIALEEVSDNKRYPGSYPYRYANGLSSNYIINPHFTDANFQLIIYGPVVNPQVTIGSTPYLVNIVLEEGEYLIIDSRSETITKVMNKGERINAFHNRQKGRKFFQKIPPGRQLIAWTGKFDFDLIIFEERGEPRWKSQ